MRIFMLLLILAVSCAAPPSIDSTEQDVCRLDPVTGRCAVYIDPIAAQQETVAWTATTYPTSTIDRVDCHAGSGIVSCSVSFTFAGHYYAYACAVAEQYDDDGNATGIEVVCTRNN